MRSECGARGRKDTVRSRAASGIMLAGTTTGPGGAFPGLGQAGAGNARVAAQGLRPPVGASFTGRASCRVPGSLAWSCAEGAKAPPVRAAVERRQASACRCTRAASADAASLRQCVCRRSASLSSLRAKRSNPVRGPDVRSETRSAFPRWIALMSYCQAPGHDYSTLLHVHRWRQLMDDRATVGAKP